MPKMTGRKRQMPPDSRDKVCSVVATAESLRLASIANGQIPKSITPEQIVMVEIGISFFDPGKGVYEKMGAGIADDLYVEAVEDVKRLTRQVDD